MKEYPKIQSVFKRDPATKFKTFLTTCSTDEIGYLYDNKWLFTEKIDGTNIRVGWDGETVEFGGRTEKAQMPASIVARLLELFPADKLAAVFPDAGDEPGKMTVTLYGEGYGNKIQKGGNLYLPDRVDFVLFDIRFGHWWLMRDSVVDIASKLGCGVVRAHGCGTIDEGIKIVKEGFQSHIAGSTRQAEGLVLRPFVNVLDRAGRRIITKLKTKDFEVPDGRG